MGLVVWLHGVDVVLCIITRFSLGDSFRCSSNRICDGIDQQLYAILLLEIGATVSCFF